MKDTIINAAVSAIIAGLIVLFSSGSFGTFGAVSRAPNVDAEFKSITVTGVDEDTSVGFTAGISNFSGLLTLNAGQLRSYALATSTTDTSTPLILSDFNGYDTVIMTPNVSTLTLTLPASSTIPTFLPTAGDMQETCFINGTTTAGVNIVFAGGTGTTLLVASSSASALGSLVIGPQKKGCFDFTRGNATATTFDIIASFISFL